MPPSLINITRTDRGTRRAGKPDKRDLKVALVYMPFGGADRPPVGISTLKACLTERSIACDVHYLNFLFAEWMGPANYQWLCDRASHMVFAGEWAFSQEFYGSEAEPAEKYFDHIRNFLGVPAETAELVAGLRSLVRPFLDLSFYSMDWEKYDVIGFSSTFEQNFPSLCLARKIKQSFPDKVIVMGGANCEGNMGAAIHEEFPFLDFVLSGYAETSFPDLLDRLAANDRVDDIRGLHYRQDGQTFGTSSSGAEIAMDRLPVPDYDDYYHQIAKTSIPKHLNLRLQIETARGCWWGAKKHCKFCGLNAESMAFRSKSGTRVVEELEYLTSRYGLRGVDAVDNILDMRYFADVLPELKRRELKLNLFYEVKANLSKTQLELLSDAGVKLIQPGIESLSSHILKVMNKGVSGLQNIQLLKWCSEFDVTPSWNLLYGFPGETPADYAEMAKLIPLLIHLSAPRGSGRIRLDRFSPYFETPSDHGLTNTRPLKVYDHLYRSVEDRLRQIAYFYDFDYVDQPPPESYVGPVIEQLDEWRRAEARGASLEMTRIGPDEILIRDRRTERNIDTELTGSVAQIYSICDQGNTPASIERELKRIGTNLSPSHITEQLEDLCLQDLMIGLDDRFLSLAVSKGGRERNYL